MLSMANVLLMKLWCRGPPSPSQKRKTENKGYMICSKSLSCLGEVRIQTGLSTSRAVLYQLQSINSFIWQKFIRSTLILHQEQCESQNKSTGGFFWPIQIGPVPESVVDRQQGKTL